MRLGRKVLVKILLFILQHSIIFIVIFSRQCEGIFCTLYTIFFVLYFSSLISHPHDPHLTLEVKEPTASLAIFSSNTGPSQRRIFSDVLGAFCYIKDVRIL